VLNLNLNVKIPSVRSRHAGITVRDKIVVIGGHKRVNNIFVRRDDIWIFDAVTEKFEKKKYLFVKIQNVYLHFQEYGEEK